MVQATQSLIDKFGVGAVDLGMPFGIIRVIYCYPAIPEWLLLRGFLSGITDDNVSQVYVTSGSTVVLAYSNKPGMCPNCGMKHDEE